MVQWWCVKLFTGIMSGKQLVSIPAFSLHYSQPLKDNQLKCLTSTLTTIYIHNMTVTMTLHDVSNLGQCDSPLLMVSCFILLCSCDICRTSSSCPCTRFIQRRMNTDDDGSHHLDDDEWMIFTLDNGDNDPPASNTMTTTWMPMMATITTGVDDAITTTTPMLKSRPLDDSNHPDNGNDGNHRLTTQHQCWWHDHDHHPDDGNDGNHCLDNPPPASMMQQWWPPRWQWQWGHD